MNILEEIKNLLIDKKNSYFLLTTRNNHLCKIYNVFDDLIDYNEKCVFLIGQENTYLLTTNKNIIHDNNNEKDYRVILTKDEDDIIEKIKAKLNDNELIIDSRTISTSLAFKLGNSINNIKEDQTITPFVFKQDKKLSLVYKLDEFEGNFVCNEEEINEGLTLFSYPYNKYDESVKFSGGNCSIVSKEVRSGRDNNEIWKNCFKVNYPWRIGPGNSGSPVFVKNVIYGILI